MNKVKLLIGDDIQGVSQRMYREASKEPQLANFNGIIIFMFNNEQRTDVDAVMEILSKVAPR